MSISKTTSPEKAPAGSSDNPLPVTSGLEFTFSVMINKSANNGGGPFDLTGWTGRGEVRRLVEETGTPVATFTVVNSATTTGKATVSLTAPQTLAIPKDRYVFDVEFINDINPNRVIPGTDGIQHMCVNLGVTKINP